MTPPITKTDFNRWFGVAASSNPATAGGKAAYDPPAYAKCVANKTKTAPKPAKGQPATTPAQFKSQCQQEYEGLRDQVLQFLILEKWVSGEATDQGIKVTAKENEADFAKAKKDAFPKESDFTKFLQQSGMTVADARFQVFFNSVYTKLREKAIKGAEKVTDKSIAAFYAKNKKRFAQPETRDVRVVLTKTKDKADAARKALAQRRQLQGGRRRSTRSTRPPRPPAACCSGIAKGSQEKAFDTALFSAKKGVLTGPGQGPVRLLRLQGPEDRPGQAADAQGVRAAIKQELTAQHPEGRRRQVQRRSAQEVEGEDELPQGLRHGPVQERSEGQDRRRPPPARCRRRRRRHPPRRSAARRSPGRRPSRARVVRPRVRAR